MSKIKSAGLAIGLGLAPVLVYASVESSLMAIQSKLINTILPLGGVLGLGFAAVSFFMGSPNATQHLKLAVIGAAIGFGGPAIIDLVRSLIH
ncbi:MAG: hypothetical protein AB7G93_00915 [Bdellovibrionales bacterium]